MAESFNVTPWKVEGKIDYDALEKQFGIKPINDELLKKIEKYAGPLHWLLRRKIFFAQRELAWLLDEYEKGNKFYLYTGLAPSGQMHIGHLLPFMFTQWLQEKFNVEVLIQIPDEEKYWARQNLGLGLDDYHKLAEDVALNIAALGFNRNRTKIFLDTDYAKTLYKQAVKVAGHITFSTVKDAFGVGNDTNIGWIFYTSMQAVPAFLKSVEQGRNVPCLIPLGVDQDVHFRVARDVIGKLGYYKPAIMHNMFLPSLSGEAKMSASEKTGTIYLNDDHEEVERKVGKALTGQQATAELQRKYGGNPDKCMVCQYYRFLFEPDDKKLAKIFEAERDGSMLAGEHKEDLAIRINKFLDNHRRKRERAKEKMDDFIVKD
jgi:tryptophanyl-tRNA synthetase